MLHCIKANFKDNITFITYLCNNIRFHHCNFDIKNVRMYVYCNVMPANGALHPKYVEEIGTYETHPYKCV
jgi:hypothetical protein